VLWREPMRGHLRSLSAKLLVLALLFFATSSARAQEERRDSYEAALMGGFGYLGEYKGTGPAVSLEVGGRHQLDAFSYSIGLRARYEQYQPSGIGLCSPAPFLAGAPCAAGATSFNFTLNETLVTIEVPITVRLGSANGTIFPYLGVAPGLVFDRADIAATSNSASTIETSGRLSIHSYVGTQLRLGPGGVFFEWGLRASPAEHRAEGDSYFTSFLGSLGYRLSL
jgi:hypothetical protein